MANHRLKTAILLALLPAAPALAWPTGTTHDRSNCPQERARAAAAAKITAANVTWKKAAPTTVVVKGSGGLATWGQFASDLMP